MFKKQMFKKWIHWAFRRFNVAHHWQADAIQNEWFLAHFQAAGIVHDWLSPHIEISSSRLLDLGCGDGIMALSMALRYAPQDVHGVDITQTWPRLLQTARREIGLSRLPANLHFSQISLGQSLTSLGLFDVVFSWSTFEHIESSYLSSILRDIYISVRPNGFLFIQIEPLFYSPFGSHLGRFGVGPWAHLLLSQNELEQQIMSFSGIIPKVEIEYNFHVRTLEEYKSFIFSEYKKLNGLTADQLIDLVKAAGFGILREIRSQSNIDPPKTLLQKYRLNDLLTNQVVLLAKKPG